MKLIFTITSEQRAGLGPEARHVFDSRGGSIGRAPESDWVLPDIKRIVSNRHSIIDFRDGGFFLTDTSTNGVFLNGGDKPLGYNNTVRLREGDTLGIGEYRIRIEVESADWASAPIDRDDLPHSLDAVISEPARPHSANSEPLPLGLGGGGGLRLDSKSSLAKGWDRKDDGFNQPASQPDHTPAINDAFSLPSAHVEQLPADWDRIFANPDVSGTEGGGPVSEDGFLSSTPSNSPDSRRKSSGYDTPSVPLTSFNRDYNGINEFLRGAGIDSAKVHASNPKLSLEQIGSLYREMVQGVMDILIARSSLKNEFRMPHTILRATENNPLKFSMSVDDALEYLLFKEGDGFLPAGEAFREAYQDIKDHQFATVVGMRAAFNSLLRMFAPKKLQSKFKSGSKRGGLLPRNRNAANWELYEEWYAALASDTDDHFQQLFAAAFGRAYEEQIERLSAARKQRQT
jgi:type VI secretion system protein